MNIWAAGYHPQVRVAPQTGRSVRGHEVGTDRFMYAAGHAHGLAHSVIMTRCKLSQEVHKQPVYVAFTLIRRRLEGVVIHSP